MEDNIKLCAKTKAHTTLTREDIKGDRKDSHLFFYHVSKILQYLHHIFCSQEFEGLPASETLQSSSGGAGYNETHLKYFYISANSINKRR